MQKERASKKQQELLSFVDGFIKGDGYGPSYREIMRALGYKSVSTVAIHIDGLIAKGYLARRDKSARSLEVVAVREPRSTDGTPAKTDISKDLERHIASLDLDDEKRVHIAKSLEYLGFDTLASSITPEHADA